MSDIDSLPCPVCDRPLGEHTMAEYRDHTTTRMGFQPVEHMVERPADEVPICDHLDVAATVMEVKMQSGTVLVFPALEFKFSSSHTGPVPPVVWTADKPELFADLCKLVASACDLAPMRAKQRRRELDRQEREQ